MAEPDLSRFVVVLCRAEEAGNVGSACRAMKTMGLTRLALAGCPDYDEARLRSMAVHAADVYEEAERHPDLEAALAARSLSAGFTRRRGQRRKAFSLSVADFADRLASPGGEVALVFGNERTGLTARELGLCSLAVHIPSSELFPSINLAQAVQIACYELRRRAVGGLDGSALPAARALVDEAVERIIDDLGRLGFFKLVGPEELSAFLRDSAQRAAYTPSELRYFETLFHKVSGMARREAGGR